MQNLDNRTPIVNPDGTPTEYFMRLLQGRGGLLEDAGDQIERLDGEVTALLARQIIAGDGLDGGGPLSANVTLSADVQEILDQITVNQGYILYRSAGGWAALAPGTLGEVLQTNGAGADPSWAPAGGASDIQTLLDGISTTQGVLIYYDGTNWVALAPGTSGHFLKTNGAGANPAWASAAADIQALLDGISTTQGAILYNNGTDWVALAPGTAGYVLQTKGAGQNPAWVLASGGGSGVTPDIAVNLVYIPITFNVNNVNAVGMAGTVSNTSSLSYAATNSFTRTPQMRIGPATANTFGQVRSTLGYFQSGAGLKYSGQFGVHTAGANMRIMAGFYAAGWTGTTDVSNATNCFFVGKDSADTNLQIMHNDGSGTCTKIDLGSNFPANTSQTDHYYIELTIDPGGASASYYVRRVNTGDEASGTIATNLPVTNVGMFAGQWGCTGATATACYLSFMGFQVVSPPS